MRPVTIVLIAVALLIAGGLAFFSKRLVEGQVATAVKKAEEAETVQVMVAARPIGTGKVLAADDFRYEKWPKAIASGQVIVRKGNEDPRKDYIGYVARRDLMPGEPIGPSSVHQAEGGGKLAVLLDPGMRAITINITAESAVAGLALPGDRVDVVLSADVAKIGGELKPTAANEFVRYASETVLRNVKVLAIDQALTQQSGSGKEKEAPKKQDVGKTATLEVTPEDAEKLVLAGQMGKLSLILRSVAKSTDEDRKGAFTGDLEVSTILRSLAGGRGGAAKAPAADESSAPAKAKSKAAGPVIINRGGERIAR